MDRLNQYQANPPNLDWQRTRHAAEAADVENNQFASSFADPDDDASDYYADDFDDDADDETDDESGDDAGEQGSSFDLTGAFKRRAISWALAIFSPPGTGPLFGFAAWAIQWQHKKDDET